MKNSLQDLNNILFEQIERINDDSLSDEEREAAIEKAETINKLGITIVSNANVQLKAYQEFGRPASKGVEEMLGIEDGRR